MGASINFHLGDATPDIRSGRTGEGGTYLALDVDYDNVSLYFPSVQSFLRTARRMLDHAERLHREERQALEETTQERSVAPF